MQKQTVQERIQECKNSPNSLYTKNLIKTWLLPIIERQGDIVKYNKIARDYSLPTLPEPTVKSITYNNIYEIANS